MYFNRQDVKAAIHAPENVQWTECTNPVFTGDGDTSPPASWTILPQLLKRGVPVVVVTGLADFVLLSEG